MSSESTTAPKFQIGDRVVVSRPGADQSLIDRIIEVDDKRIVTHYIVEFNRGVYQQRFPEFALVAVLPD